MSIKIVYSYNKKYNNNNNSSNNNNNNNNNNNSNNALIYIVHILNPMRFTLDKSNNINIYIYKVN